MELNAPLHNAIYCLEKTDELVHQACIEHENELSGNVSWPCMNDMYRRNYEYCCGVASTFLLGQFPSSEALCRTAIEGAVNLHYVSLGDSMEKQIAYFKDHLKIERKQNKNWKESVQRSKHPQELKSHHLQRIAGKYAALDHYEYVLRESLALAGVNFDTVELPWPSTFDRFKEIDDEVGYRTVYAALCSQAHNDAEDVLNKIMLRAIGNVESMAEAQWVEQYNFSLYFLLMAIYYHIMATAMYIAKFQITADRLIEISNVVADSIVMVTKHGPQLVSEKIRIRENR